MSAIILECKSCDDPLGSPTCNSCESWLEIVHIDNEHMFINPCELCLTNLENRLLAQGEKAE